MVDLFCPDIFLSTDQIFPTQICPTKTDFHDQNKFPSSEATIKQLHHAQHLVEWQVKESCQKNELSSQLWWSRFSSRLNYIIFLDGFPSQTEILM